MVGCQSRAPEPAVAADTIESSSESKVTTDQGSENVPSDIDLSDPEQRDHQLRLAQQHIEAGQVGEAGPIVRGILLVDPDNAEAVFMSATIAMANGNTDDAVSQLDAIPIDNPRLGIAALGQAAELCIESERFEDAITRLLMLIEKVPSSVPAHRRLAFLFNRQGRRHEAARHIRVLCKIGNVRQEELHALMVLSDAIYDDPNDMTPIKPGTRRFLPIGASGLARKLFSDERYLEAAELLSNSFQTGHAPPEIVALYGRCLAEAQDDERFAEWLSHADATLEDCAEYWSAVGAWLLNQQRFDESVRAMMEALLRDPTDVRSCRRINQALVALGRSDDATKWDDRHQLLRTVTLASNEIGKQDVPDLELLKQVISGLNDLHRPLESLLWKSIEMHYHGNLQENEQGKRQGDLAELNEQRLAIVRSGFSFPSRSERVCGMDSQSFPLFAKTIALEVNSDRKSLTPRVNIAEPPRFEEIAAKIGLSHTYRVAAAPLEAGFSIYQVVGGGVAVLDFDLDGHSDLYFAQGGSDPPEMISERSNQLFRYDSGRVQDVTTQAGAGDQRYSTGVTAGDWNQDGFADIVVANLGADTLLINNGDGTFRREDTDSKSDITMVSTSIAIADLSGDGLPDIYEQTYVHDPDFDIKPTINEKGQWEIVSPFAYQPGMDRIFINDATGGRDVRDVSQSASDRSTGLGLIIAGFDVATSPEVYVGNDMRPNQRWKRSASDGWVDVAPITGSALGHDGTRTASMGIAAADFDRSGSLDLHITNFESAPARLYMNRGGTFQDRSITFNLARDSFEVVGFGTQPIDYNNDGFPDLVVTNGHVENTKIPGSPFEQPAQLFANFGDHFELVDVNDQSGYFEQLHVGRGLARLDFNQDGMPDFVVTHLETPSAVLLNRTETRNHWLDVKVVGVKCERDCIGGRVELKAGSQTWTNWVISGDGYLCRNEAVLSFGLGEIDRIDTMTVHWPDGSKQTFSDLPVDRRILAVQNDETIFTETFGLDRE